MSQLSSGDWRVCRDWSSDDARSDEHLCRVRFEHIPGWTSRRAGHARPAEIVRDGEGERDRGPVREPVRLHFGEQPHVDLLHAVASNRLGEVTGRDRRRRGRDCEHASCGITESNVALNRSVARLQYKAVLTDRNLIDESSHEFDLTFRHALETP